MPASGFGADLEEQPADPAPIAELLAHHLGGRPAQILTAPDEDEAAAIAALTRAGVVTAARRDLAAQAPGA